MEFDVSQFYYLGKRSGLKDGKSAIWAFRYKEEWYFGLNQTALRWLYPVEFPENDLREFSLSCNFHISNKEEYSNILIVTNLLDLDSSVSIENINGEIGMFNFSNEKNYDDQYLDYQREYLVNAVKKTGQIQEYTPDSHILLTCEVTSNFAGPQKLIMGKDTIPLATNRKIKTMQNGKVFDLSNFYIDEVNLDYMCKLFKKFLNEKDSSNESTNSAIE